jgi:hypothetical protein
MRWTPPRLTDCLLAGDPWSGFARPRDEPEVARRSKHQQGQGGQRRRPTKSCHGTVIGK